MGGLERGTIIDRYEVDARIGVGGMADVYRVRHRSLHTVHALKLLTYRSEEVDARFVREGVVQSQLDHPHIVRVRDVLEHEGAPALLMDYVEGPDLHRLVLLAPLSIDEVLGLSHGILRALAFAHGRRVIHRDLKPPNVLLRRVGVGVVPVLADFGLAKAFAGPAARGPRTRSGMMMGTPVYMPPEQMRDAAKVDHRADLFAFGVLLYALLTGREPWPGPSVMAVVRGRKAGPPPQIGQVRDDVPGTLRETVLALLSLDPAGRPADALQALERLGLAAEPVRQAIPPVTGPAVRRALS